MELLFLGGVGSALTVPIFARLAYALGAVDRPDGLRKRHARPTPRLGGMAIFFSVFAAAFFLLPPSALRAAWLSGGALLCVLGVSDDIFSLPPQLKLLAEVSIATLPIAFGTIPNSFSFFSHTFTPPDWVRHLFCVIWITVLSNAFNLIDGLDTLAVTQAMLSLSVFATHPAALLLFGGLFGFLPYNKNGYSPLLGVLPTRSFLGDTGALFIGFSLALLTLAQKEFSLLIPLVFLFPLGECFISFLRRTLKGKNPLSADRGHLHHKIYEQTNSVGAAVLALGSLSAVGITVFLILN